MKIYDSRAFLVLGIAFVVCQFSKCERGLMHPITVHFIRSCLYDPSRVPYENKSRKASDTYFHMVRDKWATL